MTTTNGFANGKAAATGNRHRKPPVHPIDPDAIHDGLKAFDRWLGWRWQWKADRSKWDKPPINARTGGCGTSTDPKTWCSFEAAIAGVDAGRCEGVGIALGEADGGVTFAGIDLDNCRNPETGELSPLARDVIATMRTYAEVSPTGTGIKLLCIGTLPEKHATENKARTIEVYTRGRYFTVTGQHVEGTPRRVEKRQSELTAVYEKYIASEAVGQQAKRESQLGDRELAIEALTALDPILADSYSDWLMVGMALHNASADLLSEWDRWSQSSAKYASGVCAEKWESFKGGTGYGLGTLIYYAKQNGWVPPRKTTSVVDFRHCTDVGNAQRFAEQHGADVRFCHAWRKWLVWDGRRWAIDDSGEVMRRAKRTAVSILAEASNASDKDSREELVKWSKASERRERLTAMVALAESEQPIPIAVESLDAEPWLLNCENGTIDLRTGELREHRREDYLTKLSPVEYPTEPGIDPELWLAFLDRIFDSNAPLIGFLQRLVGMALVGEVLENILPIFYGSGANGKSVFVETICGVLGPDYAMVAGTSLLMVDRSGRHPTERTDLHGRRFVAANESGDGGRLSEETVKQLTSRENIRARRMREDSWEFKPSHTVVLATNHKPEVRGCDHGIWRRLRIVPFTVTIPESDRDPELANKLQVEWPAILRWAVAGCIAWQRGGLQAPSEVLRATDSYRNDMDLLGEFLMERCVVEDSCEARASDLYRAYKNWAEERGERSITQTKFGLRITDRGFTKRPDASNRVVYVGIGLLPG